MLAAKNKNSDAIDLMLDKNADPDESDQNKYTALTYAILAENVEITEKSIDKTTTHLSVSLEKLAESKLTSKYISRSRRG